MSRGANLLHRGRDLPPEGGEVGELGDVAFHSLTPAQSAEKLGTDPVAGLSAAEATRRLETSGRNELPPPRREPWWLRLLRQFKEPMALLLIGAAAVSGAALGEIVDAAVILAIVILNAVLAVVQEGRAARALDALQEFETDTATVRRSGRDVPVPAAELTTGDLVVLRAGDRVPADIRLSETSFLEVDESLLTGESLPVAKSAASTADPDAPLGERVGMSYSGTLVTRGSGVGLVAATGTGTQLGRIAAELSEPQSATPLQQELASLTGRLGVLAVIVAAGVFALTAARAGFDGDGLQDAFLSAVALAVAAVPEGLATVTTVALALGVQRMARRGAIVRRLPAVETLGSTTALVIDKTGTVTQNRMQVEQVTLSNGETVAFESVPSAIRTPLNRVSVLCNEATLDPPTGDPIEVALLEAVTGPVVQRFRGSHERVSDIPFDSERRRMTTLHRGDGRLVLSVKGAPEEVLDRCSSALDPSGSPVPLDDSEREHLAGMIDAMAADGIRTLALAQAEPDSAPDDLEELETGLTLVALVGTRDPVRPGAADSVAAIRRSGVGLIMATGDHPGTASAVAVEVGITDGGRVVPTGRDIREAVPEDPLEHPVYARVDPDQKLALVERLQENGHIAAMTGDGVNDAPALRKSDIGVALGKTGSAVAREASDIIVTDDDLATIVDAIHEGRSIYDNIRKVVEYLVAANLAEILVFVVSLIAFSQLGVPLWPIQLLWINLLTDGIPALAIGADPPGPGLMDRPPRPRGEPLLHGRRMRRLLGRAGLIALSTLGALTATVYVGGWDWDVGQTVLFTTLVFAQAFYAFAVRLPDLTSSSGSSRRDDGRGLPGPAPWTNPKLIAGVTLSLALQILIVQWPAAHEIFHTVSLDPVLWVVIVVAGILPALTLGLLRLARRARPDREETRR